jgi:hypothetical protein
MEAESTLQIPECSASRTLRVRDGSKLYAETSKPLVIWVERTERKRQLPQKPDDEWIDKRERCTLILMRMNVSANFGRVCWDSVFFPIVDRESSRGPRALVRLNDPFCVR